MAVWTLIVIAGASLVGCGGSGPEGTWVLSDDSKQDMVKDVAKQMPEEMAKKFVDNFKVEITFLGDGTFTMNGAVGIEEMGGVNEMSGKGTWKLEGTALHAEQTEENGEKMATPDEKIMHFEGGKIRIPKDNEMPFDLWLERK